ncbi:DUF3122 domain-containing protein [Leptolyngbya cf. ectocarpi LEGE 11479]|uniref:DUF3122 domain-containing protein n=1 Tax=Leptolyngbya cf. ectocarpi LEGE 11479 TaxID=1828722 RepID=A0A928X3H2_LEPEC|nr:DUF3122 domain-containing protein [Leptolyngbya ectocarpi]MBE9066661.1 DUF3122 domain-containing protein [Leptolyngbya cf. ectocarpi LEGE 11479]
MIHRLVSVSRCVLGRRLLSMIMLSLVLSIFLNTPSVLASVHVYHERPGQTTLRSQQSLRDRNDRSWQAILFKRYRPDGLDGLYLRLVGFPGVVDVAPQKTLLIDTGTSLQWQAQPKLDPPTPALPSNTNQYDVAEVITDLKKAIPLTLVVPLQGQAPSEIIVPPYAVQEWLDLAAQTITQPTAETAE